MHGRLETKGKTKIPAHHMSSLFVIIQCGRRCIRSIIQEATLRLRSRSHLLERLDSEQCFSHLRKHRSPNKSVEGGEGESPWLALRSRAELSWLVVVVEDDEGRCRSRAASSSFCSPLSSPIPHTHGPPVPTLHPRRVGFPLLRRLPR